MNNQALSLKIYIYIYIDEYGLFNIEKKTLWWAYDLKTAYERRVPAVQSVSSQ